ncbi:MAG: S-layer homology domain-containing protein [Oscillospiraceae bacterium]|jgi:hypothetical protein|nr:S-layer homology domain-containing protein [Oscillospiraceae bacterium]
MKTMKRLLAVVLCIAMIAVTGIPALAVTNEQPNGDGFTAYNLHWDNPQAGLASFYIQSQDHPYAIELFKDGKSIGNIIRERQEGNRIFVNFSPFMTEPGAYHFTVTCMTWVTSPYGLEIGHPQNGQVRTSEVFNLGATTLGALGDPANLRIAVDGTVVTCTWDIPAGWTAGRDSFAVGFTGRNLEDLGLGYQEWGISANVSEARYVTDLRNFPSSPHGANSEATIVYYFAVQAVSGNTAVVASSNSVLSPTVYNSRTGEIIPNTQANQGDTTPATPNLDSASSWAREGITAAIGKGFVPADIQGNYTNVITRAEFCRLAVRWLEVRLDKTIDAIVAEHGIAERMGHTFSDTTNTNILAAYRLGVTGGEVAPTDAAPGRFNPSGQFNREQAATMILNTVKVAGMDVSNTASAGFNDIGTASSWAVNAINYVRNAGIMSGTGTADNPLFSPQRAYTRQESIVTFNNIG